MCIVIRSATLTWLASWFFPVAAITLWPFIIVNPEHESDRLINHEKIHIAQQEEMWVLGFYAVYLWDWIRNLIRTKSTRQAYMAIRFEQEAYAKEGIEDYLDTRERFAWRKYSL